MIDEVRKLLDDHVIWLKDKTSLRDLKDVVEITALRSYGRHARAVEPASGSRRGPGCMTKTLIGYM